MTKRRGRRKRSRSNKKTSAPSFFSRLTEQSFLTNTPLDRVSPWLAEKVSSWRSEILGVLLILLAFATGLVLLTPEPGALGIVWLSVLRTSLGWGMFVAPLGLLAIGFWLAVRRFETELPDFDLEQLLGGLMLLMGTLAGLHALELLAGTADPFQVAEAGRGGGYIGGALLYLLVSALGGPGTAVALSIWIILGVTFLVQRSPAALLGRLTTSSYRWLQDQIEPPARKAVPGEPAILAPPGASGHAVDDVAPPRRADDIPSPPIREGGGGRSLPWKLPEISTILSKGEANWADRTFDRERARLIEETLESFGAPARVVEVNRGPTITQFGVEPDFVRGRRGRPVKVKVSKIASLADDLALALAAPSIRIEAPVPGKGFVGIEVPNTDVSLVALRDVMESSAFEGIDSRLRIGLGRDVSGHPKAADLASMPHLLIAGTTGSGKSVCVNAIISCLMLQNSPDQLRMVMVDPKRVELTLYNGIPHLLAPVVVDLERVVPAMQWVSREMDERYRTFSREGVRNIRAYNEAMRQSGGEPLPYLVLIVDELADLMMLAPDETERVLTRLAQLARATGIHLVIATQRPSVDVVTGLIKANFPARIAFAVASSVDSRVILDQPGAERLLGKGDMLYQAPDAASPVRLQGVFVSDPELGRLVRYWKTQSLGSPEAVERARPAEVIPPGASLRQAPLWKEIENEPEEDVDELFDEAVRTVRRRRKASISMLQRRLRIGYTRAARIIDEMEQRGIVGPEPGGSQARQVLDYGGFEESDGQARAS